jgi:hypothetical protein
MPYKFSFDLSRISKAFFRELASVAAEKGLHRKLGGQARHLADRFRIHEITGLEVSDALMLVEDLVDIYVRNISERQRFCETSRRALFLPHCSRKYMDKRCQARFNAEIPSYSCGHCSEDCLVNQATKLGEKKGYDVFVLAGGSCIPKILKKRGYEGAIGVACSDELKMAGDYLERLGLTGQAVPLTKNGCANTKFSLNTLRKVMYLS